MLTKQTDKISIIVPFYNIKRYIKENIDSITQQSYSNLEIIYVDDGSTDSTLEIIHDLAKSDSRIQIIKQKNQGAGAARNNGLRYASGKYVIFLDADDYFDRNLIEKLVIQAERMQSEVCICKAFALQENGKKVEMNYNNTIFKQYCNKVFSAYDIVTNILTSFSVEPWNKLYRRDFLVDLGIQFQELRKTNDLYFTSVTLVNAKRIAVVDEHLIYYRVNNRFKLIKKYDNKLVDFCRALVSTYQYIDERKAMIVFKKSYYEMATGVIFYNLSLPMIKAVRKLIINYLFDNAFISLDLHKNYRGKSLGFIYRLQYWLLKKRVSAKIQRLSYKILKTYEFQTKNGLRSTLEKIIKYYI